MKQLTKTIEKGFGQKQYTVGVFLDVAHAQAFDRLWLVSLEYTNLLNLNLPQSGLYKPEFLRAAS